MSEYKDERCGTCKFLRANGTCKESHGKKNGSHDWCGAWKKKKGVQ